MSSKNFKNKKNLLLKSTLLILALLVSLEVSAVWMPPTTAPTGGNTVAPINVGPSLQEKIGALIVRGFRVLGPQSLAIFDGQVEIQGGNPGVDKILASTNTNGLATWKTLAELGGGGGGSGMTNPMTTLGDMIYASASGTPAVASRLGIGNPGDVLTVVNGIPSWQPQGAPSAGGWTDDGTVVRLTTSTDKVGIGTSTPTQQLEITKNMKIPPTSGVGGTAGVILVGDNRFIHTYGPDNTFIGKNAGTFQIGGKMNTGVGTQALGKLNSGEWNTAVGGSALYENTGGSQNVAVGFESLKNNTVGSGNVAAGYQSLFTNSSSSGNVAVGANSLKNTTGNYNVGIGYNAGDTNQSGTNNVIVGYNADVNGAGLSNATAIGANAVVNSSDTMVFGSSSVTGWGFGTQPTNVAIKVGTNTTNGNGAVLTSNGNWQGPSDRTKKHNIQNINYGLEDIIKLRPVSFDWNGSNTKDIGFIAQEVKEIIPEIVSGEEGEMTMSYGQMTAVLTKAVQELKEENDALKARIEVLKAKLGVK